MDKIDTREQKHAKAILIIIAILLFLSLIWFLISRIKEYNLQKQTEANLGQIQSQETISESIVSYTPSEALVNADEDYYNSHGNLVAIIDEKSALSAPDFLTMRLHMTKNELITTFLKENGYDDCKYVSVIDKSTITDGSKSEFQLALIDYPGIYLLVEAYNLTETMEFTLLYSSDDK